MNPHFSQPLFTLPSFGSGFKVQGSGFRIEVAASPPFLEDGILISQPSPLGNAIKLGGRTFLAPHRGSSPKGEARRYVANDFLNLIALPL